MLLEKISYYKALLGTALRSLAPLKEIISASHIEKLKEKHQDSKSLIPYGYKVFSQNDEDGIIAEIFKRIGTTNKTFIEFGIGNGLENNTLALLFNSWNGLWIDSSSESINKIRTHFSSLIKNERLKIENAFVTKNNINQLISANIKEKEIDLLSIDIDGNDFHIFEVIDSVNPRVIIMEYNSKFPPPISCCMKYDEKHIWQIDDCMGASLKYLETHLSKSNYILVGCNLTGSNAFFIRKDLVKNNFLEPFTAENHFQPSRFYLCSLYSGHKTSYETINKFIVE